MNLPSTIRSPSAFRNALPAGFDGAFDWSWTKGCFDDRDKISPMDFDGVVERKGQFLVFETKDKKSIPSGQFYTLMSAHRLGCFTVMIIEGKTRPERGCIWWPGDQISKDCLGEEFTGLDEARSLVCLWYKLADSGKFPGRIP